MSTNLESNVFITNGPTDQELANAYIYAFDRRHPDFTVEFTGYWGSVSESKMTLPFTAQITGLVYESGARGMMIIEANLWLGHGRPWKVVGLYNATTRSGVLRPGHLAVVEELQS